MKNIKNVSFIIVAMTVLLFNAQAQAENGAMETHSNKVINRQYKESDEKIKWEIEIDYPELVLDNQKTADDFNRLSKSQAMTWANEFKQSSTEIGETSDLVDYGLYIGYEVEFINDDLISIIFRYTSDTGGAHPSHWSSTLNYDLKNNRLITLEQLFKPDSYFLHFISKHSIRQILNQKENKLDKEWVKKGTRKAIKSFKYWNITQKGLKFTFDEYQVAPYVEGAFTTFIPYEAFPLAIHSPFFYTVSSLSYIDGNPPNWCRNGFFPKENIKFGLAKIKVKGYKKNRVYFYNDNDACPNGTNCRAKSYLIAGDEVIVSRTYGDFVCSWYQPKKGKATVGWISDEHLDFIPLPSNNSQKNWLGHWGYAENNLKISSSKQAGFLTVKGNAFWQGVGDNVHIGEVDSIAKVTVNSLMIITDDKDDCHIKIQKIGKFLLVADNHHCGGLNVTFNGVYVRK